MSEAKKSVCGVAAIGRSRARWPPSRTGAGRRRIARCAASTCSISQPKRARRGARDRRVSACRSARDFRAVVERAVPGLRRRARRERDAEERQPGRSTTARCVRPARAEPRRDGRGDLHGQPAGAQDRGARSDELPLAEYFRQIFWGSGIDVPDDLEQLIEEITLDAVELPPGEKALLSLQLPAEFMILFDPVTHAAQFLDVKGEPTRERQSLSLVFEQGSRADRNRPSCARARCGCRLRTAPTGGSCPGSGSPATSCTSCSAGAGRS